MWVNSLTSVPFPVPIIMKAMDDLKFVVKENHDAKKQALLLIKELPEVLPLERAKMRVKITCISQDKSKEVKEFLESKFKSKEKGESNPYTLENEFNVGLSEDAEKIELVYLIMPHLIKDIMNLWNKDKSLTFEEIDHYVYSRLVSQEELEQAQKLYDESVAERERKIEEDISKPIIVSKEEKKGPALKSANQDSQIKCTTCNNIEFETKEEFKSHYKTEWHIENTKRKVSGKPIMGIEEFQKWREDELDKEIFNLKNKNKNKGKKGKKNRKISD